MKAAVVPSVKGKWAVQEVPTPEPGPNEVLIKIHASGLCYTDVHITEGAFPVEFPRVLGHEPVGEIAKIGVGVNSRKIGDRVGVPWVQSSCGRCEWCMRGRLMFCPTHVGTGIQTQGSHAQYMLANADSTMLLPDGLDYELAAPIFCAGYTVWSGLRWANPQPSERVAVVGIGGLGHLAIQYAKAAGFHTIAVSRSKDKEEMIRQLGADDVVSDAAGLEAIGGADVILCTGNSSKSVSESVRGLRPDGRLVVMGLDAEPVQISPMDLIIKRIKVLGSQQNNREYLYEALDLVAKGKVKPMIETFALDEIALAYHKVEKGQVRFRAVIRMA